MSKMPPTKKTYVCKFESYKNFKKTTFHKLITVILLIARCFAVFPVSGITKDVKDLNFKWKSFLVLFSLFALTTKIFYTTVVLMFSKFDIKQIFSMVFILWDLRAISEIILFVKVAYNWPNFLKNLWNIEKSMMCYGSVKHLRLKFIILPLIFAIFGIGEHSLYILIKLRKIIKNTEDGDDLMKKYFTGIYIHFFYGVPYAPWKGFLMEFQSTVSTFSWQFSDLLLVLISIFLAEKFKQISNKIGSEKQFEPSEWEEIRKAYTRLTHFCKMVNNLIFEMMTISMVGNICYLSIYIFQAFKQRTRGEAIYFWYNMMFVLFHFVTVSLYTAKVNEESVKPMKQIFNIKSENMHYETYLLLQQCAINSPGITVCGIFKVTRSIILDVTVVIVTIQLLLYQFYGHVVADV